MSVYFDRTHVDSAVHGPEMASRHEREPRFNAALMGRRNRAVLAGLPRASVCGQVGKMKLCFWPEYNRK